MGSGVGSGRNWLVGSVFAIMLPVLSPPAHATTEPGHKTSLNVAPPSRHEQARHQAIKHVTHTSVRVGSAHSVPSKARVRVAALSCVPYARSTSGILVAGNAWQWWDHAAGTYQRGSVPEPGSVLAFRSNVHMRLGHVAVVTRVINDREIQVDHANWAGRGVTRGVPVVDVSENNDWTAVRVGLGRADSFGSVYPTYGFIYDRPDNGTMLAAITSPAPQPALNPAPRDLRPTSVRTTVAHAKRRQYDEVAEAPEHPRQGHGNSLTMDH